MKVAVPVLEDRVSPVFDTARKLLVVELENGQEVARYMQEIHAESYYQRVHCLVTGEINVLICGAISRPLATFITAAGIELIPWIRGRITEVLAAFNRGALPAPEFMMPGCRCQCRRRRRRRQRNN